MLKSRAVATAPGMTSCQSIGDHFDAARLDNAFRAIHTLKGSVALFDFAPMGVALHAAEDLLGDIRRKNVVAGRDMIDALLEWRDYQIYEIEVSFLHDPSGATCLCALSQ